MLASQAVDILPGRRLFMRYTTVKPGTLYTLALPAALVLALLTGWLTSTARVQSITVGLGGAFHADVLSQRAILARLAHMTITLNRVEIKYSENRFSMV